MSQKLHGEYMDVYEGIQSKIVNSYLGRVDKENKNKLRAGNVIPNIRTWVYFR